MEFFKKIDLKPMNILKISGLVLMVILVLVLALRLIGSSIEPLVYRMGISNVAYQSTSSFDTDDMYGVSEGAVYSKGGSALSLSVRNVDPAYLSDNGSVIVGEDAEEFEVTEYSASIETRHLADTCSEIAGLKVRDDVIFESANEYEKSCNYSFKVKKESVAEILAIIEALDPKELNESAYTIKRLIDDYTSEVEILEREMSSIEETLANAISAYDDITNLATRTQDVESLAKIIDSKIGIIERLTQERININAQLERLERSKAEQLDRLEYTYFNVYVFENKFIDGENLKDSWKNAIKSFVRDINEIAQDMSINLVSLLFLIFQYVIYFFIILFVVKYGWRLVKHIWQK